MNRIWLALFVAPLLVCGCGREDSSLPPVARPIDLSATNAAPLPGTVDHRMTAQLKRFVAEKGRLPNSFLEFAGAKLDVIPRAPEGFSYEIDPATTEVKLVKQ